MFIFDLSWCLLLCFHYFRSEWDSNISCFVCVQDVDSAYLVKADLEDKVGSLTDEINFLRNIYEEVFSKFSKIKFDLKYPFFYNIFGVCFSTDFFCS